MHKDIIDLSRKYARAKPLSIPKTRDQITLIAASLINKRCKTLDTSIKQTRTRIIENTNNNIFDMGPFILLGILDDAYSKFTNFYISMTNMVADFGISADTIDDETRLTVFNFIIRYGTRSILRLSNGVIISQVTIE